MGIDVRQQHEYQKHAEYKWNNRDDGKRSFLYFEMHEMHRHQGRFPDRESNQQGGYQHFWQSQKGYTDLDNRQHRKDDKNLYIVMLRMSCGCHVLSFNFSTADKRR